MTAIKILPILILAGLMCCPVARGDLGTCLVFSTGIGPGTEEVVSNYIHNAYARSSDGDAHIVFVLDVVSGSSTLAPVTYSVQEASLAIGKTCTLHGYRIRAGDIDGLMNGAIELKNAFDAGRVRDIESGKRSGMLVEPLYEE